MAKKNKKKKEGKGFWGFVSKQLGIGQKTEYPFFKDAYGKTKRKGK